MSLRMVGMFHIRTFFKGIQIALGPGKLPGPFFSIRPHMHEGNGFLANMAKRLDQDQSEHSLSYAPTVLDRELKPDSSENRSGTMPLIILCKNYEYP